MRGPAETRRRGARIALPALACAVAACAPPPAASSPTPGPAPAAAAFPDEPTPLLRFRSRRYGLSLPLPDGRAWAIDDHNGPTLTARHDATRSTLAALTFHEPELMNRRRCQDRAEERGLLSLRAPQTIEDAVVSQPSGFDARMWIAIEAGGSRGSLVGHAILVGSSIRKCLLVHYVTQVDGERDEPVLTSRLAVARLRILAGVEVVAFDEAPKARAGGE